MGEESTLTVNIKIKRKYEVDVAGYTLSTDSCGDHEVILEKVPEYIADHMRTYGLRDVEFLGADISTKAHPYFRGLREKTLALLEETQ